MYSTICVEWADDRFGDVNRSTLHKDTIQWPWPLTFGPQICCPLLLSSVMFPLN